MAWKASWAHRTGENEKKKILINFKNRSERRAPVVFTALLFEKGVRNVETAKIA